MLSLGSLGEQVGLVMNSGVPTKQRSTVPIAQLCATKCSLCVDVRLLVEKLQNQQSQTGGQCSGKLQSSPSPVPPSSIINLHQILFVISDKIALNLKAHCFCPTLSSDGLESFISNLVMLLLSVWRRRVGGRGRWRDLFRFKAPEGLCPASATHRRG